MTAVLYARVSTRDKGQDLDNQLHQLRRFADVQGWTITAEYIDRESGKTSERAQFQRLFEEASRRAFDVVLFWSLDRFSREGAFATLQHLNRLTSYGVQFRSFTEQYIDSCGIFAEAVISILAVLAKQERERISERTKAGLDRARRQGTTLGRPRRIVDREWIRTAHEEGRSYASIARELGISTATVSRRLSPLNGAFSGN